MTTVRPELGFERLLAALERDLLDATDQEIRDAAKEIGIDPTLKGSAALFGVLFTIERIPRKRVRSAENTLRPAETSSGTRTQRSSSSTTGSPRRRRSKKEPPASD